MTKLPTIDIKGKEYVLVVDRIKAFNDLYPNGSIRTERLTNGNLEVVRAVVVPDVKNPDRFFSGLSQADPSQGMVNKMAALENCETSAVGRALGMMGIGVIESIASADEMAKVGVSNTPKKAVDPSSDQMCPIHNVSVPARLGKNGKDYWKCFEDGGHFLNDPNKTFEDVKLPYYDKEDIKEPNF